MLLLLLFLLRFCFCSGADFLCAKSTGCSWHKALTPKVVRSTVQETKITMKPVKQLFVDNTSKCFTVIHKMRGQIGG